MPRSALRLAIHATVAAIVAVPVVFAPGVGSVAQPAVVQGTVNDEIRGALEAVRAKYNMPSLAGGFTIGGRVFEYATTGWRQWGAETKVTDDDVFHLGSVTKSITGTVIAKLVEQGVLTWTSPWTS